MRKVTTGIIITVMLKECLAFGTPSTTLWTPASTYIQPFAVPHLTYDSYFIGSADFPTDVGLTVGILPFKKFQSEVGFDLFLPGSYPLQLNAKAGIPEDAFFKYMPGVNVGILGVGFKKGVNNYNILYANIGKTIPYIGSVTFGFYRGLNKNLLVNSGGEVEATGFMVSYYRTLDPLTDRIAITADWMSGDNAFGAGGAGLYFWPSKTIDIIAGWIWFNDTGVNPYPDGVFTIQVDVDFDFFKKD